MRIYLLVVTVFICNALFAQQKQIQYLSGTGSDRTVAWDFYCTGGRNSGYWTRIQVPSCWEQQGFGTYNYGRDYKTYGKNFRFADEQGRYRHTFNVPAFWKGKEVFIVFEGSMTDTKVKINGRSAGAVHRGAFYRFKYNITDKLKYGSNNLLEAEVSKMSADVSVNNAERLADYWVFGGIFRPVYLEAVNKAFIDYVAIDAKANGNFSMQVFPVNIQGAKTVEAQITDMKGNPVAATSAAVKAGDSVITLQTVAKNILQWTSESPNLYKVNVCLKDNNKTIYQLQEKFGFRTIEVRQGDGIYINGTQVKMKGINRHCFWPETGRTLNDSLQLLDVNLIKEMNMNAVRCSHYPPDKRFLDLCDSLGLYVLDELAGWQKAYSTAAGKPLVKEMILKDLNHPSIIFWDNGNEGGTNKELDAEFTKWDFSQRPVIHPHHRPGNDFNGIDCNHYEDYYSTQKILNDSLIYMPTEFLHSQDDGGGGSGMYDFWNLHWNAKRSGGGFIWAFIDEGIMRTDMNNIVDANGLNANDGILGPHREKEGSFYALREIFSPVRIETVKLPSGFNGSLEMENRYHFTNLNECKYQWALVNYRSPFDLQFSGYTIEKTGIAKCPSIKPLAKGDLNLGLPADFSNYDALVLRATGKDGKEICKWIWKLKTNEALLSKWWGMPDGKTGITESDSLVTLRDNGLEVAVNRYTGMLAGVKNAALGMDNLSFTNGPVLVQGSAAIKEVKVNKDESSPSVEFTCSGNMKYIKWAIQKNGWVRLDYEYTLEGAYPFAGISFSYPENYILSARWLGKGPYRQWKNRQQGTPVNVWQNFYNNTQTGYWPMVYPEFKGYYGDITWMEFNTVQGRFYVATKDENLNVRLFNFYGFTGPHPLPDLPTGNISFLDAIPPIGSKLALNINGNAKVLGPQSELTQFNGAVKHTLYFYFGLPEISDAKEQYSRPKVDNVF
ncbi:MAG: glycoside hydrolase family 2 TIM barrel-domain containing protein [Niabella sp.]